MRHALLLAGGQGRRFWPLSRLRRPKQFMRLWGEQSLLSATSARLVSLVPMERQWVVTHRDYAGRARRELTGVARAHVIGEPVGLNTAPAIALAAALMLREDAEAVMVVQAADHWIQDVRRFRDLVAFGFAHAERTGDPLLVGYRPTRPHPGYGYIGAGARLRSPKGFELFRVDCYKEKPSARTARRYLRAGYLWNGCTFLWRARTILEGIREFLPEVARLVEQAVRSRHLEKAIDAAYRRIDPVSIEHGVLERLAGKVVLAGDCGWEDVGSWSALFGLAQADREGNVARGRHLGIDTRSSLVLSDGGLVVTLGVKDLIVVREGDAVLVMPRRREGQMRRVVEAIAASPGLERFL